MSAIAAARCSATRSPTCSTFAGYEVTREYYINDAGAQVDVLARSAFLRYREALGEDIGAIPEGLYPGDYLKPVGAGARRTTTATTLLQEAGERMAADRARARHRHDDGGDPRRSRGAQCRARTCSSPSASLTRRPAIRSARRIDVPAQARARLRGPAAAAEGRAGRGLGGPRADAVPRHRVRRRRRPAAEEIGRQLHLFRLRHRLSQVEVRPRLPR